MDEKDRWDMLDRLFAERGLALPAEIYAELAERLREAIAARDPALLTALAAQLTDLSAAAANQAAPEALAAAEGRGIESSAHAFALGQLGFAYQIAAAAAQKRADAGFEATLMKEPFIRYVRAIYAGDLTGTALAEAVDQRAETVSRNLKVLREIGAVDFRREGTNLINFLTPAARHLVAEVEGPILRTNLAPVVRERLADEHRGLRDFMRSTQTFAHEIDAANDTQELALASR